MTTERVDTLDWPKLRPLRILLTFSDNSSKATLNGNVLFSNIGAALPIWVPARIDPLLREGENILKFTGYNDLSSPHNPNPWRFDLAIQDNLGDKWDDYRRYDETSADYPHDSPPLGKVYELTLTINVK